MKKLLTGIFAIGMAILGYTIVDNVDTSVPFFSKGNTLAAATVPQLDVTTQRTPKITVEEGVREVFIIDSVLVHDTVTVTNTKYVRVPVTKHTTDTVYIVDASLQDIAVDSVKNKSPGDCEEQSVDVILTIDGKMVYSSKSTPDEP
jgi:hypothetical protein